MTYTLKDLKHLEVIAELEKKEPMPEKQINLNLFTDNKPKAQGTQEKILTLCAKLRKEGFDKQANALENKFMSYKMATTHLYRAIDEDGEDVINSAHPDGEVKVEDADNDLGVVETGLTQHKKIVDIINKKPTGKLAKYVLECQEILKQGQATMGVYTLYKLYQSAKQLWGDLVEKAEVVKSKLDSLSSDGDARKNPKLIELISDAKVEITSVISDKAFFESVGMSGAESGISGGEIDRHLNDLNKLKEKLTDLKKEIDRTFTALTRGIKGKLYHYTFSTIFKEAKESIQNFEEELYLMLHTLSNMKEKNSPTVVTNSIDTSINQLNVWSNSLNQRTDLNDEMKTKINVWIQAQIQEMKDNANNPEKLKELLKENENFKAAWKL